MTKQIIADTNAEGLPLSEAVRAGDFIFVSGMVGFDDNAEIVPGGVGAEVNKIFDDLADILGRAGATIDDLVKVNVYLAYAVDFDAFNKVYSDCIGGEPPARICVVTALTIDARVEMDFVAYIGNPTSS